LNQSRSGSSSGIHSLIACHGGSIGSMVSMSKGGGGRASWMTPSQSPWGREIRTRNETRRDTACGEVAQSCQFKHKEVIIGKLEPRMDANEREFSRSYKNP
jgi:hypothetical protein